jgi:hypothetical protein
MVPHSQLRQCTHATGEPAAPMFVVLRALAMTLGMSIYMLWRLLGYASLIGLALMVVCIPVMTLFSKASMVGSRQLFLLLGLSVPSGFLVAFEKPSKRSSFTFAVLVVRGVAMPVAARGLTLCPRCMVLHVRFTLHNFPCAPLCLPGCHQRADWPAGCADGSSE